jgi:IclR family transcriptional regulator, KDG regulon repressor
MNSSRSALIRDAALGASVVKPVACAMRVLDEIACSRKGRSLANLATATGLKKTTVYRYVCTLQQLGYVCFDRRAGGYFLGPRIWNLCTEDNSERTLTGISNSPMEWLHKSFRHTVNLARLKGRRIHYLRVIPGSEADGIRAGQGDADELHCTALGKVILAHISEELVPDLLREPLKPLTSYTITDRRVLFRELREVRKRGYSIDREENEVGFVCFAAPIIDAHCFPVGAISVSLSTRRMSEQLDLDISDAVVTAGLMITRRLRADGISTPSANPSTSRRGFARIRATTEPPVSNNL